MDKTTNLQKSKPIIAVDIDDVLADFVSKFCGLARENWGENITPENFSEDWFKMFRKNDAKTVKNRAAEMFQNAEFYREMKPILGARETLEKLSKKFDLIPLTSRVISLRDLTNDWLSVNFGGIFREIIFSGAYELNQNYRETIHKTKGEICREIGAKFLIDDQPKHANSFAKVGGDAILFGDYGWNRDAKISAGAVRAKNWKEVAEYFGV